MTAPRLHPGEETLLAFAAGQADLPLRALVETHLAACPACRTQAAELTAAGGALLRALRSDASPDASLGELWRRLEARLDDQPRPAAFPDPSLPLPAAALADLPALAAPRWRWAWAPDAEWTLLARDPGGQSMLLAARMPAARSFPRHLHVGPEDIVVLTGGYDDHLGTYEVDDYAAYAPGTSHRPTTDPDEGCAILVRLERPNRFFGWRGVLQRLLGHV